MSLTEISLLRHGEVYNPTDVYYGRLPRFRLSETGKREAAAAANHLADRPVAVVFSSPLLRARQTARIVAARLNLRIRLSNSLLEVLSPHDGRPRRVLEQRGWDLYTGSPPAFERPEDVAERMTRFFSRQRQRFRGRHVVAVTHADPVAWSVLWAAGAPLTLDARRHLRRVGLPVDYPPHACVVTLAFQIGVTRPIRIDFFAPKPPESAESS